MVNCRVEDGFNQFSSLSTIFRWMKTKFIMSIRLAKNRNRM